VTRGGVVLTVNGDRDEVERQLAGGDLACPSCGGVLGGWGNGRLRPVRAVEGPDVEVVPRRSRCRQCGATHVLLPAWCLLRRFAGRAEAVRVFFTVLLARTAPDPVMPAGAAGPVAAAVSAIAGAPTSNPVGHRPREMVRLRVVEHHDLLMVMEVPASNDDRCRPSQDPPPYGCSGTLPPVAYAASCKRASW
jgi:hypothetical protein